MSLYFVFTVDGDWDEYFDTSLDPLLRKPFKPGMIYLVEREIEIAQELLEGKFIHFIHTSPTVRDTFLRPAFMPYWKKIEESGGSIGVHCHEDMPGEAYHFADEERMNQVIGFFAKALRNNGLHPDSYRGGYMAFSRKTIPILEENHILLDFSCDPGRHLKHNGQLVSDWRDAPANFYRLSYEDHRKPGNSQVYEIPLGIYLDTDSLWSIWQQAIALSPKPGLKIVSVLSHSYEFGSLRKRLKIKLALLILKKYGKFINVREALEIMKGGV